MIRKALSNEIIRYSIFGVLIALVNLGIYTGLLSIGMRYEVANIFALLLSLVAGFGLNKYFVFGCIVKGRFHREFWGFMAARGFSSLVDYFGLILLVEQFHIQKVLASSNGFLSTQIIALPALPDSVSVLMTRVKSSVVLLGCDAVDTGVGVGVGVGVEVGAAKASAEFDTVSVTIATTRAIHFFFITVLLLFSNIFVSEWKRLFLGKIVFYSTFFTSSDSFLNFYQTLQPKCRIYTGDSIFQERVVLLFYWSYFLNQRSPVRLVDWRCPRLKTICPTVCLGQVLLL